MCPLVTLQEHVVEVPTNRGEGDREAGGRVARCSTWDRHVPKVEIQYVERDSRGAADHL